jgi:hypothetical protein
MDLQDVALEALSYATYNALLQHEPFLSKLKKKHPKKLKSDQVFSLLNLEKEEEEGQGQGVN